MSQQQPGHSHLLGTTNVMAVAALVCSLMCTIGGLVLAIIALRQIKHSGGAQTGRGLALGGLAVSLVKITFWLVAGLLTVVYGQDVGSWVDRLGIF